MNTQAVNTKTAKKSRRKVIFAYFGAIIHWMAYKACYQHYEFDGTEFSYRVYFKARWYSPLYVLYMVIGLLISPIFGGMAEFFSTVSYEITRPDKGEDLNNSYSNSFKDGVSMFQRRLILFRLIYQY